jgi:hypothetical protein
MYWVSTGENYVIQKPSKQLSEKRTNVSTSKKYNNTAVTEIAQNVFNENVHRVQNRL